MAKHSYLLVVAYFIAAISASSPATSAENSWVERRCAAYRGDYCRVPFQVVVTRPEDLKSVQRVQVRGYLVRESHGYALYASKDSAIRGWRSDALLISEAADDEVGKSLDRWNESLVELRGRLVLVALDYDEYWLKFELDSPAFVASVRGETLKP